MVNTYGQLGPRPCADPQAGAHGQAVRLDTWDSGWTSLEQDQLLVTFSGATRLHTQGRAQILPRGYAAWIPGRISYRLTCVQSVDLSVIRFPKEADDHGQVTVFQAPPLTIAMGRQAGRWGPHPPPGTPAPTFYAALRGLIPLWRAQPMGVSLPRARRPQLRRALAHLHDRLGRPVGLPDAARAGGMSERTVQRRCKAELGMSLRAWLIRARVLAALELLAYPTPAIGEIAKRCGYSSPAAFSRIFALHLGRTPSGWRATTGPGPAAA